MAERSDDTRVVFEMAQELRADAKAIAKSDPVPFMRERADTRTARARWQRMTLEARREAINQRGYARILKELSG